MQDRATRGLLPLVICAVVVGISTVTGLYFDPSSPFNGAPALTQRQLVPVFFGTFAGSFVLLFLVRFLLMRYASYGDGGRTEDGYALLVGPALRTAGLILLLWAPYLLLCYPGSVPYDGIYQLLMALGYKPFTAAHPLVTTLLAGVVFRLGAAVSDNMGVFAGVLIQSIVCAGIYGYAIAWLSHRTQSRVVHLVLVCFYGLLPTWGVWAQTFGKDTLYYALFTLFVLMVAQLLLEGAYPTRLVVLALAGMLMCLFRRESVMIVVITLLMLIIWSGEVRMAACLSLAAVLIVYGGLDRIVAPHIVEEEAPNRYDALAVAFQQTARTVATHGDELSDQDLAVIDAVLGVDDLATRYNPYCADPVKDRIPTTVTTRQVAAYLGVWFRELPTYPTTYLAAFLQQGFGYLYPPYMYDGLDQYKFYIKGEPLNTGQLDLHYANESAKSMVARGVRYFSTHPVVGYLDNCGTYGLLVLVTFALTCAGRRKDLALALLPMVLCLMVCLISPVNAYLRYALPNMAAMPLALYVTGQAYATEPARALHARRGYDADVDESW